MKFYKYQGAGNDFLIADNRDGRIREVDGVLTAGRADGTVWTAEISELCDRRYGVGADGLMLLENGGQDLDFRMVYFNSDGSGGMMCGNGGRCIVAFAADMGVEASGEDGTYVFEAADGLHTAQVIMDEGKVKTVRIKMKDVSEAVHHESLRMVCGLEDYDVVNEGRTIRYGAEELKPIGANVNFIEPEEGILKVRTYEKGVEDETFACGTGIVASAIAAYLNGLPSTSSAGDLLTYDIRAKRDALRVEFRPVASGGFLAVDVYLTGPATYVAEISF